MPSSLDGFRAWMERAVRPDWTAHTIDYSLFKQRLKFWARRRARIRSMLREAPDHCIAEEMLTTILGIAPKQVKGARRSTITEMHEDGVPASIGGDATTQEALEDCEHDYIEFIDLEPTASSDLESDATSNNGGTRKSQRKAMRRVSHVERTEMSQLLQLEMEKVHVFYVTQWQQLSAHLEAWTPDNDDVEPNGLVGTELLELWAHIVLNICAVRQMLIRYDAYARSSDGTPMLSFYLKQATRRPTAFRKVLFHDELIALADLYLQQQTDEKVREHFVAQRDMLKGILETSSAGIHQQQPATDMLWTFWDWTNLAFLEDRLGWDAALWMTTMRGKSLTAEMQQIAKWRTQKLHGSSTAPMGKPPKSLTPMQVYHLTLNLLSAFLYCLNYYIVEPSSTMYVNRLGAQDAMSGTLIGMMPLAAFMSSLPYSMWTNRSFRYPFIMSCCLLIVGNIMYSLADKYRLLHVALAGRFIAGLGAPKCIIRRYMADTTPLSVRTSVNAGFGMVVAAGSAMGPAMAIVLNQVEAVVGVPYLGIIFLNGLTLPGYFMACLWATFAIIVLLTFEEPDRAGLKEQQELEKARTTIVAAPSTTSGGASVASVAESSGDDLRSLYSNDSEYQKQFKQSFFDDYEDDDDEDLSWWTTLGRKIVRAYRGARHFGELITFPVRICLALLFAKVFTIESLASATSALSKNRYHWHVEQVGSLGLVNGLLVIPFSLLIGRLSMTYQDRLLMRWLVCAGIFGMFCLIDLSDLVGTPTRDYNNGHPLAVGPHRYIFGYFLSYLSIQAFEGVIGSTLSKVIPTALASGTINSGLLATLVDTFGRACGDMFISLAGFINLRQLMNLLFIPGFFILLTCLVVIEKYRDLLAV